MTSKPVAFLLADLGITKTHSRPYTSTDNPYLRGAVQDAQVPARLSRPLHLDRAGARVLPRVLWLVQQSPPSFRDRPDEPGDRPPRAGPEGSRRARGRPEDRLRGTARALYQPAARPTRAPGRGVDQQAHRHRQRQPGGRPLNSRPRCLIRLDRFRPVRRFTPTIRQASELSIPCWIRPTNCPRFPASTSRQECPSPRSTTSIAHPDPPRRCDVRWNPPHHGGANSDHHSHLHRLIAREGQPVRRPHHGDTFVADSHLS